MADSPTIERIKQEVSGNEVMLFMKGTPVFPQCGFSAAATLLPWPGARALSSVG